MLMHFQLTEIESLAIHALLSDEQYVKQLSPLDYGTK